MSMRIPSRSKLPNREDRRRVQREFLEEGHLELTFDLLSSISGVEFFIKNRESRYVIVSPGLLLRLGCLDSSDILGYTDYDYILPNVADEYLRDDQAVIREELPIVNRFELFSPFASASSLVQTTKFPLRDSSGSVAGLVGLIKHCAAMSKDVPEKFRNTFRSILFQLIESIQQNLDRKLTLRDLCELTGRSSREISQTVNNYFGMRVSTFVEQVRFQCIARALLISNEQVGGVAERFGFGSASAFCVRFRNVTGWTPMELRKNWEKSQMFASKAND